MRLSEGEPATKAAFRFFLVHIHTCPPQSHCPCCACMCAWGKLLYEYIKLTQLFLTLLTSFMHMHLGLAHGEVEGQVPHPAFS